jgi:hypothetical protein
LAHEPEVCSIERGARRGRARGIDHFSPGPSLFRAAARAETLESEQSAEVVSSAESLNFDDSGLFNSLRAEMSQQRC